MESLDGDIHHQLLELALAEARKCEPVSTAFCVGCILATSWPSQKSEKPVILASGYSRELHGNTHAEANALTKAEALSTTDLETLFPSAPLSSSLTEILAHTDVYTTLEPCSVRTSGLSPCADALILANVRRCFIGVGEPDDFVKCEGAEKLKNAGIDVVWLKGFENECLKEARRGHNTQ